MSGGAGVPLNRRFRPVQPGWAGLVSTGRGRDLHCRPMKKVIVILVVLALAALAVKKLQDAA